jgi:putative ATP-dependent endonuclease of OLD family
MKVRRLKMTNFRSVATGDILLNDNTLLVGGNNVGKSTVCEALDLLLGPERLFRRPVVDEHDFHASRYVDGDGAPIEIRLEAVLIDLSEEAERRFGQHLRRWDDKTSEYLDEEPDGADKSDADGTVWALPIVFVGRYDPDEDDFVGETFFDHPVPDDEDLDDETGASLGGGRASFTRAHKRMCGFVFLRALRTGTRALSLQRGSLLDTILRLAEDGSTEMWRETLRSLESLDPAIGEVEQLKAIRNGMKERLARFVNLAPGDDSTTFFASDLTREHLREVVRLFIATQPSEHLVPYSRQGTGSVNLTVFALLTLIADLKGSRSVIFAMEEPEIALPPHTQRRVTRYVLQQMGQAIVTSHSPYVIEQFEPDNIVMLTRSGPGQLTGQPIDTTSVKPKNYRTQRRQFAEAILARGVLVCEGSTESVVASAASSALERIRGDKYRHLDLAGISLFTADGDGDVPRYGPIFAALDKKAYAFCDKPKATLTAEATTQIASYDRYFASPELAVEQLLVKQTPLTVLRRFLAAVSNRSDYPSKAAVYSDATADANVPGVALSVLTARKGEAYGYAGMLLDHCEIEAEVPQFLRDMLDAIDSDLSSATDPLPAAPASAPAPSEDAKDGTE